MKATEHRVTSETGGEKGMKLPRLGGTDPQAMMELAKVYGMGEMKYARYNYLKGYPWSLSVDALLRHLFAFLDGEDRDECTVHEGTHEYDPDACDGSGLLHTAHVAWHALALTSFTQRGIGTDDRAPRRPVDDKCPSPFRANPFSDERPTQQWSSAGVSWAPFDPISYMPPYTPPVLCAPPVRMACDHPVERRYTSVAGTTNCAKCYQVLHDPSRRPVAPWGDV